MARLTRTQKYAELRDQLENGREIEIKSEALNKFEDKLEQLNIDAVNVKEELTEAPKEEAPEAPEEEMVNPVAEETTTEEVPTEEVIDDANEVVTEEAPEVLKEEINDDYVPFDFDEPVKEANEANDEPVSEESAVNETPVETVVEEHAEEEPAAQNDPQVTEEVTEEVSEEPIDLLDSLLSDFEDVKPIVEVPETEIKEETAENTIEAEIVAETSEEPEEEVSQEASADSEPVDLLDTLLADTDSITPITEKTEEVPDEKVNEEPVSEEPAEDVKEENPVLEETEKTVTEETVLEPAVTSAEAEVIDNQYLEECLNEVNEYNKSKGLMTADEVPSTILNEIRGINTQEMPVINENTEDELSNTVTLEIKKILSELEAEENKEEFTHEVEAQMPPTAEEELPKEVSDMLKSYMNSEEKKTDSDLQETMLVQNMADIKEEIKAAKENAAAEATLDSTLLNETMPLEVAGDTAIVHKTENDDEDDEDEERGPNRILNFILISLIVVLLLILGFIGYLILVAQGII